MERSEFSILVKAMKAVYSDPKFIADKDAFNVWYELLKDIPYAMCEASLHKYMATNKYPPTIADIRQSALEIATPDVMGEAEAWALVYKAICNSTYHAREEFDKLPVDCQKAIGSPSILREWAGLATDEVNTVIQSNFMRVYKTTAKKTQEYKQLPESTRKIIEKISEQSSIGLLNKEG